jgi:hypothetical protein
MKKTKTKIRSIKLTAEKVAKDLSLVQYEEYVKSKNRELDELENLMSEEPPQKASYRAYDDLMTYGEVDPAYPTGEVQSKTATLGVAPEPLLKSGKTVKEVLEESETSGGTFKTYQRAEIQSGGTYQRTQGSLPSYNFQGSHSVGKALPKVAYSGGAYLPPSAKIEEQERGEILPEIDSDTARNASDQQVFETIRESIKIVRDAERTLIYAVVKSKDDTKNVLCKIKCQGGTAYGGYAREASSDSFIASCVTFINLGTVPFGFRIMMPHVGNWSSQIPIPEKVIEKSLTPDQRGLLLKTRQDYPSDAYEISYLQMTI